MTQTRASLAINLNAVVQNTNYLPSFIISAVETVFFILSQKINNFFIRTARTVFFKTHFHQKRILYSGDESLDFFFEKDLKIEELKINEHFFVISRKKIKNEFSCLLAEVYENIINI